MLSGLYMCVCVCVCVLGGGGFCADGCVDGWVGGWRGLCGCETERCCCSSMTQKSTETENWLFLCGDRRRNPSTDSLLQWARQSPLSPSPHTPAPQASKMCCTLSLFQGEHKKPGRASSSMVSVFKYSSYPNDKYFLGSLWLLIKHAENRCPNSPPTFSFTLPDSGWCFWLHNWACPVQKNTVQR